MKKWRKVDGFRLFLYTFLFFAYNSVMRAEFVFLIVSVGIFFPIYITINFVIDFAVGKVYFCVNCFNFPILGGYILQKCEKLFFHISDKRAIIFNLFEYVKRRKKFFKIKGVEVLNFYVFTKNGVQADNWLIPQSVFVGCSIFFSILKNKKKFVKLHNAIELCSGTQVYSVFSLKAVFNVITLFVIILRGVIRGIFKNDKR